MRGRNLKKLLDAITLLAQPCRTTIAELGRRCRWTNARRNQVVFETITTKKPPQKRGLL
jgi:hypothetical protein